MKRDILNGLWCELTSKEQFAVLRCYGRLEKPALAPMARIERGKWSGPGRYLLLTYEKRCPRNCCWDLVRELRSDAEVIAECRQKIRDLVQVIKTARSTARNFP